MPRICMPLKDLVRTGSNGIWARARIRDTLSRVKSPAFPLFRPETLGQSTTTDCAELCYPAEKLAGQGARGEKRNQPREW